MDNEVKERAASRPWRVEDHDTIWILDADGECVAALAPVGKANAELIVDAVNAYDRVIAKEKAVAEEITHLRQTLKRLADMYMDHTVWRLSRDEQALIDEARAALGKEPAHV